MEEESIINGIWNRDESALCELAKLYSSYCRKIAANLLSDESDIEEILNDVWLGTWNSIPPNHPEHLSSYLAKITRNLSIKRYRKLHAQKRGNPEAELVFEELEQCISLRQEPEEVVEAKELSSYINEFLCLLPERDRVAFVRRYWFLDPVSLISERLQCSDVSTKVRLWRIRNKLKQFLDDKEGRNEC